MIGMSRYTSLSTTHCMKTSKYLPVIIFVSAIFGLLDPQAPAWGLNLPRPSVSHAVGKLSPSDRYLAQAPEINKPESTDRKTELSLPSGIGVSRSNSDKSLLTVTGSIENSSDRPHYVYYIVAKLIVNDTAIKQTIIPINSDIEPGASKSFTHEVSTNAKDSKVPAVVVVKYEYR
jgi:hypothetical protein